MWMDHVKEWIHVLDDSKQNIKEAQSSAQSALSSILDVKETFWESLLQAMEEDIQQLTKEELQSLLEMLGDLNASGRRDAIVEHVSFRDWMFNHSELFPETSQVLEDVDMTPSPQLIKELTDLVNIQLEDYFEEDDYLEDREY